MEEILGPAALQHAKDIERRLNARIEQLGKVLGIPQDSPRLLAIAKILEIEAVRDEIKTLRDESECWHRDEVEEKEHQFNPTIFLRDMCSSIIGSLDAHYPQKKKR